MDDVTRRDVAERLLAATRDVEPIEPPSAVYPGFGIDDAYGVQLHQVATRLDEGRVVVGHKVGLTSRAMQQQLGVDEPDYGHLFDDMVHAESVPIDVDRFISPRIEPEVAFVLREPLRGPGVTVAQAVAAVDFVLPALEIIDSRIRDWRITLADTVADNASSGGVVLGSRPTALADVDLALVGCVLTSGGAVVGTGAGAAVLGSPVNALVWLANTLGRRGVGLEAGQVVLPGSITAAVPVRAGDGVTASFDRLGSVTARFTGRAS